jgi:molecular chaperone GrpE
MRGLCQTQAKEGDTKPEAAAAEKLPAEEQKDGEQKDLQAQVAQLEHELVEANRKLQEAKESRMVALAEVENVRKRAERNVADAKQHGQQKFAQAMLEVYDNLERAVHNVPEGAQEQDHLLKTFVEGVIMTEKVMLTVLEKEGVTKFHSAGEPFDPNLHQALFEMPTEGESGIVQQVIKSGFMYNKRVLRPAQVGVSKKAE